ncbi:MAG: MFS transporter [Actinomycetaceae bacterium]|nr:MFS transporter [Actinomycetaceae bacterium]
MKRPLFYFLAGEVTSLIGNSIIGVVLPLLVLQKTGDPAMAGIVATVSALPGIGATIIGGWLIDKVGRQRMSVFSDIGSALSVAGLVIVDMTLGLSLGAFIILGVLGALFDGPGQTARNTLIANVARTSETSVETVSSQAGAIQGISLLLGPALGGILWVLLPSSSVLWITAACSAVAAIFTALMRVAPDSIEESTEEAPGFTSALNGFSLVWASVPLRAFLLIFAGSGMLVAPLLGIILPAYFSSIGAGELTGYSVSLYAVGFTVGSVVYGILFKGRHWGAWTISLLLFLGMGVAIAPLAGFWWIGLGMVLGGIGSGISNPLMTVVFTADIPEESRGRAFAVMSTVGQVAAPIGLGLITAVIGVVNIETASWVFGALWLVMMCVAFGAPGMKHHLESLSEGDNSAIVDQLLAEEDHAQH